MQSLTELTPPTAVTHALSLPFLGPDQANLVVAKLSLLQIYAWKTIDEEFDAPTEPYKDAVSEDLNLRDTRDDDGGFESSFLVADAPFARRQRRTTTKLVLLAEYDLAGTITSMSSVKQSKSPSGGDLLLLSFRDARISLVKWDPSRFGLSTVSIHYYEQDDLGTSPWASKLNDCASYLTVDPGNRCAALRFGPRNLAILPFYISGEDTTIDDWDEELDGPRPARPTSDDSVDGQATSERSSYGNSFVLRLSSLEPRLIFPIHHAFLYEYRDPTFGVLSSTVVPSSSLPTLGKDHLTYFVFTIDLVQKASTTIQVVTGLPCDLFRVIALPLPVGGALLIGFNEIIHIDQSGKANGIAVNNSARQSTGFTLSDFGSLDLRLEGCELAQISAINGEMLVILSHGELCVLSFRIDGRSVTGLDIRRVSREAGGLCLPSGASCIATLGVESLFVGCDGADASVLGWSRSSRGPSDRRPSLPEARDDLDDLTIEDDDDDDDLYGGGGTTVPSKNASEDEKRSRSSTVGHLRFRVHDSLLNIAPVRNLTLCRSTRVAQDGFDEQEKRRRNLGFVAISGSSRTGSLIFLTREIEPQVVGHFDFTEAQGLWTMCAKRSTLNGLNDDHTRQTGVDDDLEAEFDRLMIVSKSTSDGSDESAVYALTEAGFEALTGTEFEPAAGGTVQAGVLGKGMRVIQVLKSEVRCYDGDLGLAQILPMYDEETGADPRIISASITDPYLLLIRDDASIFLAKCDDNGELDEVEKEDETLQTTKWLSGCLYTDKSQYFTRPSTDRRIDRHEMTLMFLLSADGALHIYELSSRPRAIFVAQGLCFVPPILSPKFVARRSASRETLVEIIVADLGDATLSSPHVIARSANDDVTIYVPFHALDPDLPVESLHLLKIRNPHLSSHSRNPTLDAKKTNENEARNQPMCAMQNVCGLSLVFVPGPAPRFIVKSSTSIAKAVSLHGTGVRDLSRFHTPGCDRGFIYVDYTGTSRVCQLRSDSNYTELGLILRRLPLEHDIHAIAYHDPSDTYAISTTTYESYTPPKDDDYHRERHQETIAMKPLIECDSLQLINPSNWSTIDQVEFETGELVICMETLNLEISEITHERKQLIAIGTGVSNGEDLPTKGHIYIYDVVAVVPELDRPETNKKFKLIAREEVLRGAITAVSEIGTQGFLIVAQGQKCMVRGLKEDGSLLPVAFLDMNTFVTSIKELPGSGLCVMADALKGAWLTGYMEEPYKMAVFGKQTQNMRLVAANVFPIGSELFIVVADDDCNLHILQYAPDHPKSLQGQVLLQRTTFSLGGHSTTMMVLIPRTLELTSTLAKDKDANFVAGPMISEHDLIIASSTGVISLLSAVSEQQYRRMSTLSNLMSNTLHHPCGLNPKAYRISGNAPEAIMGGRSIVDGTVLMRWMELSSQKRADIAGRVGVDPQQIREDIEGLIRGLTHL